MNEFKGFFGATRSVLSLILDLRFSENTGVVFPNMWSTADMVLHVVSIVMLGKDFL